MVWLWGRLLGILKDYTVEMHREKRQGGREKVTILCILHLTTPPRSGGAITISILQTGVLR